MDIETQRKLLTLLSEQGKRIADACYDEFFASSQDLTHVFRNTNLTLQKDRLVEGLHTIIELINNKEEVEDYLQELGIRHLSYEVEDQHYPLIQKAMQKTLSRIAEEANIKVDWQEVTQYITSNMQQGANKLEKVS